MTEAAAPTVFEYILSAFVPPKTQATECDLERLNDAHQALLRVGSFETHSHAYIRATNVLFDACLGAGMSHDEPDHEAWAAERVTRWLLSA